MAAPYPQVVLFGDSLFQNATETLNGFSLQAAMSSYCVRRFDVVNRGLSGYNTAQALKIMPDIFPLPKAAEGSPFIPKIACLVILLGANDAALPRQQDNQHVPLPDYRANLEAIITHPNIAAHKPQKIIVVTPPPVDSIRLADYESLMFGSRKSASRMASISANYAQAAREVGEQLAASDPRVVVVDLYKALMDLAVKRTPGYNAASGILLGETNGTRGYLANLLTDGLHLSGEGYRVLWDELKPHLAAPSKDGQDEGYVYPPWRVAPRFM